jgi:UDP-N-acetylmuramoyl-tripeptide--D-alanyl-D-alanine ligase
MLPESVTEIAKILDFSLLSTKKVQRASIDSRTIIAGDLFFALEGKKNNGHEYLEQVSKSGAIAGVVSRTYKGPSHGLDLIYVEDTLKALQLLAKYLIQTNDVKIIGITGSLGKTTTKDFTSTLIEGSFKVFKTPGNANSQVGLPLSILNLKEKAEVLVLEMGMSQAKDIEKLIEIAPPDIALISQIALVHAASFDSIDDIAKAKAEIFTHKQTSTSIVNLDMPCQNIVDQYLFGKKRTFSLQNKNADFFIKYTENKIEIYENNHLVLTSSWHIVGEHNLQNFLGAYVIARQLGISHQDLSNRIPLLKLPPKRLEYIKKNSILFVSDAYNASEKSMIAAFKSLPAPENGSKTIAVLGDMKELGKFSGEVHESVALEALKYIDILLCLGAESKVMHELWQSKNRKSEYFDDKLRLVEQLKLYASQGDVILLKGSRSHELDLVVEAF